MIIWLHQYIALRYICKWYIAQS